MRGMVLSTMRQPSRDEKRNDALARDSKADAVGNKISLEAKAGPQHFSELGGMPSLFGSPKLLGIDPVAVAWRHVSDQSIGLPQGTEVFHVGGDMIETEGRVDDA